MKLLEYINSDNIDNVVRLQNVVNFVNKLKNNNYIHFGNIEDLLEYQDINEIFKNYHNKIVFFVSPDTDFPPPKKPYAYDKYFNKEKLPFNYELIEYYSKTNIELLEIIEKNNLKVVTMSASLRHNNIINIPLGIFPKFDHYHYKRNEKTILCYANFGKACDRWFGNPRKLIKDIISKKDFILKEDNISQDIFYERISKSKFTICPRGCGIDTYRLWDCIVLGSIPIVEKYDIHNNYDDLPILFIENISDFENMTEDFLNIEYSKILSKEYNYEKLKFSFWENLVLSIK